MADIRDTASLDITGYLSSLDQMEQKTAQTFQTIKQQAEKGLDFKVKVSGSETVEKVIKKVKDSASSKTEVKVETTQAQKDLQKLEQQFFQTKANIAKSRNTFQGTLGIATPQEIAALRQQLLDQVTTLKTLEGQYQQLRAQGAEASKVLEGGFAAVQASAVRVVNAIDNVKSTYRDGLRIQVKPEFTQAEQEITDFRQRVQRNKVQIGVELKNLKNGSLNSDEAAIQQAKTRLEGLLSTNVKLQQEFANSSFAQAEIRQLEVLIDRSNKATDALNKLAARNSGNRTDPALEAFKRDLEIIERLTRTVKATILEGFKPDNLNPQGVETYKRQLESLQQVAKGLEQNLKNLKVRPDDQRLVGVLEAQKKIQSALQNTPKLVDPAELARLEAIRKDSELIVQLFTQAKSLGNQIVGQESISGVSRLREELKTVRGEAEKLQKTLQGQNLPASDPRLGETARLIATVQKGIDALASKKVELQTDPSALKAYRKELEAAEKTAKDFVKSLQQNSPGVFDQTAMKAYEAALKNLTKVQTELNQARLLENTARGNAKQTQDIEQAIAKTQTLIAERRAGLITQQEYVQKLTQERTLMEQIAAAAKLNPNYQQLVEQLGRVNQELLTAKKNADALNRRETFDVLGAAFSTQFVSQGAEQAGQQSLKFLFDAAKSFETARLGAVVYDRALRRLNVTVDEGEQAVGRLQQRFKADEADVKRTVGALLNQGIALNTTEQLILRIGASAVRAGIPITDTFAKIERTFQSFNSRELNLLGIGADLGKFSQQSRLATGEIDKNAAAFKFLNAIIRETDPDLEALDVTMEGFLGTVSETSTEAIKAFRELGEQALPIFTPFIKSLTEGLKTFNELPDDFKNKAVQVVAYGGAVLFVAGAFGTLVSQGLQLVLMFKSLQFLRAGSLFGGMAQGAQNAAASTGFLVRLMPVLGTAVSGLAVALGGLVLLWGTVIAKEIQFQQETNRIYDEIEARNQQVQASLQENIGEIATEFVNRLVDLAQKREELLAAQQRLKNSGDAEGAARYEEEIKATEALIIKTRDIIKFQVERFKNEQKLAQAEKDRRDSLAAYDQLSQTLAAKKTEIDVEAKSDFGKDLDKIVSEFDQLVAQVNQQVRDQDIKVQILTEIEGVRDQAIKQRAQKEIEDSKKEILAASREVEKLRGDLIADGRQKIIDGYRQEVDEFQQANTKVLADLDKKATEAFAAGDIASFNAFQQQQQALIQAETSRINLLVRKSQEELAAYDREVQEKLTQSYTGVLEARSQVFEISLQRLQTYQNQELALYGDTAEKRLQIEQRYQKSISTVRRQQLENERNIGLIGAQQELQRALVEAQSLGDRRVAAENIARNKFKQQRYNIEQQFETGLFQFRQENEQKLADLRGQMVKEEFDRRLKNVQTLSGAQLAALDEEVRARLRVALAQKTVAGSAQAKELRDVLKSLDQIRFDNLKGLKSAIKDASDFAKNIARDLLGNTLTGTQKARFDAGGSFDNQLDQIQKQRQALSKAFNATPLNLISETTLKKYRSDLAQLDQLEKQVTSQRKVAQLRAEKDFLTEQTKAVQDAVQTQLDVRVKAAEANDDLVGAAQLEVKKAQQEIQNARQDLQRVLKDSRSTPADKLNAQTRVDQAVLDLREKQLGVTDALLAQERQRFDRLGQQRDEEEAILRLRETQSKTTADQIRDKQEDIRQTEQRIRDIDQEIDRLTLLGAKRDEIAGKRQEKTNLQTTVAGQKNELSDLEVRAQQEVFDLQEQRLNLRQAELELQRVGIQTTEQQIRANEQDLPVLRERLKLLQDQVVAAQKRGAPETEVLDLQEKVLGVSKEIRENEVSTVNLRKQAAQEALDLDAQRLSLQQSILRLQEAQAKTDQEVINNRKKAVGQALDELLQAQEVLAQRVADGATQKDVLAAQEQVNTKQLGVIQAQQAVRAAEVQHIKNKLTLGESELRLQQALALTRQDQLRVAESDFVYSSQQLANAREVLALLVEQGATEAEINQARSEVNSAIGSVEEKRRQLLDLQVAGIGQELPLQEALLKLKEAQAKTEGERQEVVQQGIALAGQEVQAAKDRLNALIAAGATEEQIRQARLEVLERETQLQEKLNTQRENSLGKQKALVDSLKGLYQSQLDLLEKQARTQVELVQVRQEQMAFTLRQITAVDDEIALARKNGKSQSDINTLLMERLGLQNQLLDQQQALKALGEEFTQAQLDLLQVEQTRAVSRSGLADDRVAQTYLKQIQNLTTIQNLKQKLAASDLKELERLQLVTELRQAETQALQDQLDVQEALREREELRFNLNQKLQDLNRAAALPLEGQALAARELSDANEALSRAAAKAAPYLDLVNRGVALSEGQSKTATTAIEAYTKAIEDKREALRGVADANRDAIKGTQSLISAVQELDRKAQGGKLTPFQVMQQVQFNAQVLKNATADLNRALDSGDAQRVADALKVVTEAQQTYQNSVKSGVRRGVEVGVDQTLIGEVNAALNATRNLASDLALNFGQASDALHASQDAADTFTLDLPAKNAASIVDSMGQIQSILSSLSTGDVFQSTLNDLPERFGAAGVLSGQAFMQALRSQVTGVPVLPGKTGVPVGGTVIQNTITVQTLQINAGNTSDPKTLAVEVRRELENQYRVENQLNSP